MPTLRASALMLPDSMWPSRKERFHVGYNHPEELVHDVGTSVISSDTSCRMRYCYIKRIVNEICFAFVNVSVLLSIKICTFLNVFVSISNQFDIESFIIEDIYNFKIVLQMRYRYSSV